VDAATTAYLVLMMMLLQAKWNLNGLWVCTASRDQTVKVNMQYTSSTVLGCAMDVSQCVQVLCFAAAAAAVVIGFPQQVVLKQSNTHSNYIPRVCDEHVVAQQQSSCLKGVTGNARAVTQHITQMSHIQ